MLPSKICNPMFAEASIAKLENFDKIEDSFISSRCEGNNHALKNG
jgi:hypothetical protein